MSSLNEVESTKTDSLKPIEVLLVVEDDEFRESSAAYFRHRGYSVAAASNGEKALEIAQKRQFDAAVIDVHLPEMSGTTLLSKLRECGIDSAVVLMTCRLHIASAAALAKTESAHYVAKPIRLADLEVVLERAVESTRLQRENSRFQFALARCSLFGDFLGKSTNSYQVRTAIERLSKTSDPVLIEGEDGTGKDMVANAIHCHNLSTTGPIITVNCAAISGEQLESELFGGESGKPSFVRRSDHPILDAAHGGTLFLNDLGAMPIRLQLRLQQAIIEGKFYRACGRECLVSFRLIASTQGPFSTEIKEGRINEGLSSSLNFQKVYLAPLRQRRDDIVLLAHEFLGADWGLGEGVQDALLRYDWPGNVRQLRYAIELSKLLLHREPVIELDDLPSKILGLPLFPFGNGCAKHNLAPSSKTLDLDTLNRSHIEWVIAEVKGNKAEAARLLGVDRRSLYRLIEKYAIKYGGKFVL